MQSVTINLINTGLWILPASLVTFGTWANTEDGYINESLSKEGVEPTIILDKSDPTYELWHLVREDLAS